MTFWQFSVLSMKKISSKRHFGYSVSMGCQVPVQWRVKDISVSVGGKWIKRQVPYQLRINYYGHIRPNYDHQIVACNNYEFAIDGLPSNTDLADISVDSRGRMLCELYSAKRRNKFWTCMTGSYWICSILMFSIHASIIHFSGTHA